MKKRLSSIALILLLMATFSCKKAVENKKQDLLMSAITDGLWVVEQYFEGANNITTNFANYEFKFSGDGIVTGTKAPDVTSGTWSGNMSNYSITSNFPSAGDPVQKLNGIWKITDSYWDYVEAEMSTASGMNILHLRKKP